MIHGIGIDVVDIGRLEQAITRWGERFVNRVFTPEEIRYCSAKADPYPSYAARFAAKEAFIKALRPVAPIPMREIGVVNGEGGGPGIRLSGSASEVFSGMLQRGRVHLSLSHDRGCSIASVVIEVDSRAG